MLPTSIGQQHKQALLFLWHTAAAVAIRLLLVLLGAGDALVWQPEVTTPANTLLATREGLGLLQLGVSPYAGDSCHAPPLWLAVTAPVALHPVLFVIPNIICDLVAAAALYTAAAALYDRSSSSSSSTPRGENSLVRMLSKPPTHATPCVHHLLCFPSPHLPVSSWLTQIRRGWVPRSWRCCICSTQPPS